MDSAALESPAISQVKFRLAGGAQPILLLPVQVNGAGPFEFILDTGASTTLLTPELAASLQIEATGSRQGHTAGEVLTVQLATVDSLKVGEARRDDVDVAIVDLSQIGRTVGAKLDGDLGYNFLKHFRLTINFSALELTLEDPKRVEYLGTLGHAEVPMRLAHPSKPLILIEAYLADRGPFQFAIDTGTSTTAISPELARLLELKTRPIGPVTTGGGQITLTAARISSLRVDRAEQRDLDVIIGEFLGMISQVAGSKLDGIVGYNFLRHYKVVIDYPNETFRLQ